MAHNLDARLRALALNLRTEGERIRKHNKTLERLSDQAEENRQALVKLIARCEEARAERDQLQERLRVVREWAESLRDNGMVGEVDLKDVGEEMLTLLDRPVGGDD